MSDSKVRYPGPGCVVEFMQGNSPMLAFVLEAQGGKFRLYTQGRRETNLAESRLLPWSGPMLGQGLSRQSMDAALEERRALRADLSAGVSLAEVWDLVEGEVEKTSAEWLAGLLWENPDVNHEAAMGRALLEGRTHFRFSPPDFEIFSREAVEKRIQEAEAARLREAVVLAGAGFFRALWDIHSRRRGPLTPQETPAGEAADRLRSLVLRHLQDPEPPDEGGLWKQLTKLLPDGAQSSPHLPLHLAVAWGLVPEHHNYLLDRIGFDPGEEWADAFAAECDALGAAVASALAGAGPETRRENAAAPAVADTPFEPAAPVAADTPPESAGPVPPDGARPALEKPGFVSVDPVTTRDRDDAFFVERTPEGYRALVALACPALFWPFGGALDRHALRRCSSLYLPEGNEHMLPAHAGRELFSLDAGCVRPALLMDVRLDAAGAVASWTPRITFARIEANLSLEECEALLGDEAETPAKDEPLFAEAFALADNTPGSAGAFGGSGQGGAFPPVEISPELEAHRPMLRAALDLARLLQAARLESGAVITERPDPDVRVEGRGAGAVVHIDSSPPVYRAHLVVGELMVLCNGLFGAWAREKNVPMLFRTQDVTIPREFSGVWTEPQDIARVVRILPPAVLEMQPRRHAGLGLSAYATLSSPIRRYVDLLNQGQAVSFLRTGTPRLSAEALAALFPLISSRQDAVGQVQRFRPRYWKLLFFRQHGDKIWWDSVVTDENEAFVTVSLPWAQLIARGRRRQFDEKTRPGQRIQVRLGKIDPLMNEIQILEAREA